MSEDEYNALAAARKYVWRSLARMRAQRWSNGPADRTESVERAISDIEADLAKIDAVLDAEDRHTHTPAIPR